MLDIKGGNFGYLESESPSNIRKIKDGHVYIISHKRDSGKFNYSIISDNLGLRPNSGELNLGFDNPNQLPFDTAVSLLEFAEGKTCAELQAILNNPAIFFASET